MQVQRRLGRRLHQPPAQGTAVELIATANAGSELRRLQLRHRLGELPVRPPPCSFTIEANSTLTATFNLKAKPKFKLTVSKSGTGSGTVTSTPQRHQLRLGRGL